MNHDFWVARRNGSAWSEPEPFALEAVSPAEDYYPVVSRNGTLYFNSQREGRGKNDIFTSKFTGGKYLSAEKLSAPINTEYREFDAFVSPDEQTIIFSSERPGGVGGADIYVSFRDGKGGWSEPANLGPEVNSARSEYGSIISPDGRYFFFTSSKAGNEDIYWVSAEIIDRLRPKK
jgi:Tol biopolymer transport system component